MEETLINRLEQLELLKQIEPAKNAAAMENNPGLEQYTVCTVIRACFRMYLRDISFPRKPFRTLVGNGGYEVGLISKSAVPEAGNLR